MNSYIEPFNSESDIPWMKSVKIKDEGLLLDPDNIKREKIHHNDGLIINNNNNYSQGYQMGRFIEDPRPQMEINPPLDEPNALSHLKYNKKDNMPHKNPSLPNTSEVDYDGRRLRKTTMRKTVDYNAPIIRHLQDRLYRTDLEDGTPPQPDCLYVPHMLPPPSYRTNPVNAVTTRFIKAATNKVRCPIFCMAWTPEGRRLVTGTSSGEFTLWNGLTFNFETILQAHDCPVRSMVWSHNDSWMITGDHSGAIKYWQSNMNNVKLFQAHKEAIRGVSFSPSDNKFATGSDDGTVKLWDFRTCEEEHTLRGHGSDVKCIDWNPYNSLLASGSKDNQQPIRLWDTRIAKSVAMLHAHKATVMDIRWNQNGNWLLTASRDHLLKLFDIRNLSCEKQVFRGHKREASVVAWHPHHEGLFVSGGSDGCMMFWNVGNERESVSIEQAHDSIIWSLTWHPLGHILASGSNDHSTKFWGRNHPGDPMTDKYNLNTPSSGICIEDTSTVRGGYIPGMGPEDKVDVSLLLALAESSNKPICIPGLGRDGNEVLRLSKKIPYSKPIPKSFQAQWNVKQQNAQDTILSEENLTDSKQLLNRLLRQSPGARHVSTIKPELVYIYGKVLTVEDNSKLEKVITVNEYNLARYLASGKIRDLRAIGPQFNRKSKKRYMPLDEDFWKRSRKRIQHFQRKVERQKQALDDEYAYGPNHQQGYNNFQRGRGNNNDFENNKMGRFHQRGSFNNQNSNNNNYSQGFRQWNNNSNNQDDDYGNSNNNYNDNNNRFQRGGRGGSNFGTNSDIGQGYRRGTSGGYNRSRQIPPLTQRLDSEQHDQSMMSFQELPPYNRSKLLTNKRPYPSSENESRFYAKSKFGNNDAGENSNFSNWNASRQDHVRNNNEDGFYQNNTKNDLNNESGNWDDENTTTAWGGNEGQRNQENDNFNRRGGGNSNRGMRGFRDFRERRPMRRGGRRGGGGGDRRGLRK